MSVVGREIRDDKPTATTEYGVAERSGCPELGLAWLGESRSGVYHNQVSYCEAALQSFHVIAISSQLPLEWTDSSARKDAHDAESTVE